jgi:CheY-like chemotaxis protein
MAQLMLVDDDPGTRRYLNWPLLAQGHTIDESAVGRDALDQLRFHDFALRLLDLAMP